MPAGRVLVVDAAEAVIASVSEPLRTAGYTVEALTEPGPVLSEVERREWDLVVVGSGFPEMGSLELVRSLRARHQTLAIVALVGTGPRGLVARQAGAHSFLEKPADLTPEKVLTAAANALEHRRLREALVEAPTLNLDVRERQAILQALERTGWNKQAASGLLGLHRPTLYARMRKHGISAKRPA